MYQPEDELNQLDKLVRQLSRNVTHREIINIAKRYGWKIKPAGREKVKACRENYASVSIPGHSNGAVIPSGLAFSVIKALLQPSFEVAALKAQIKNLQSNFDLQKARADKAESQLTEVRHNNSRLEADREAAWELAQETENRNHGLRKELHQYKCWIDGLKQQIASLIQRRREQETEMLEIASEVEQKERRIQDSAEMLTQFSRRLPPKSRQELKQIIEYLLTE
jgi:hypothetical protein